jgi:hypothetical protein
MTLCSLAYVHRRFCGTYCFYLQGCWENRASCALLDGCWLGLPFDPEDGGITFTRNVGVHLSDYTVSHSRCEDCRSNGDLWTKCCRGLRGQRETQWRQCGQLYCSDLQRFCPPPQCLQLLMTDVSLTVETKFQIMLGLVRRLYCSSLKLMLEA